MGTLRKFVDHILPASNQTKEKNVDALDALDHSWGSSVPEPIDYELYLAKHRTSIANDPHRDILLFPSDDLKLTRLPCPHRIANAGAPPEALQPGAFADNPLGRHSVSFLANTEWICIHQSSALYRGSYCKLPRTDTVDKLLGVLSNYRFSVDQPDISEPTSFGVQSKLSPSHGSLGSTGTRPWAAAILPTRPRLTAADHVNSLPPADSIQSWKRNIRNKSSTIGYVRSEESKSNAEASVQGCVSSTRIDFTPDSVHYAECTLAIGSREMYSSYLRLRESLLASGQEEDTPKLGQQPAGTMSLKPYCLRQLQVEELDGQLNVTDCAKRGGAVAHPSPFRRVTTGHNLRVGQYVIAPVGWRACSYECPPSFDRRPVVPLDTIETIHAIGDNWLKLDRRADQIPVDVFIYFDQSVGGRDQRQTWLRLLQTALNTEKSRIHLGYQSLMGRTRPTRPLDYPSQLPNTGVDTNSKQTESMCEVVSVRSVLQRHAQETEFFVHHQRQKNRLRLITVCSEVRFAYDNSATSAKLRNNRKLSTASPTHRSNSINHRDFRRNGPSSSVESLNHSQPITAPSFPIHTHPFPDRTTQLCGRRFLATCIALRSLGPALVESSESSLGSQLDNPEPFFVTMFLVNTADGRRVSEDFHWNPNTPLVDAMIPPELFRQLAWTNTSVQLDAKNCSVEVKSFVNSPHSPTDRTRVQRPHRGSAPAPPFSTISLIRTPLGVQTTLETSLWNHCRSALFSIPTSIPSPASVYLVVRVDKVLNGSTGAAVEKYLKAVNTSSASALFVDDKATNETESKSSSAIHRSMLTYCRHLGRYRMPFAWGARCLTSRASIIPLFKMDSSKMSESLFIQSVQQMARLLESSSPSAVSKLPMGASACLEKRGLPSDGAPILPGPNEGATKDDSWYCELIERYLKTQLLPIRLEVGISELIDAYEGPSIYDSNLVTPDLLPLTPNHSASDPTRAIPPSHPTLRPNELILEVEHMWDFGTIMVHNPTSESGPGVVSDSDFVLFTNPNSGSLHRATQLSTLMGSTGTRSNRDSLISSSSTGSSIQLDAARNPQSAAQSRTNSLDRPTYRPSGETIGRPTTPISPELVPFTTFLNSLYVYPKFLNMAVKHGFPRARNLSCFMELRCSDDLQLSSALQVFFSRPSMRQIPFDSWCNTAVIYHEAAPHFMDNFKLCLPLHLTPQHHLLFRFYHVSVDTAGSLSAKDKLMGKKPLESSTGYAWLPILGSDGNINTGPFQLPIAAELRPGYLSAQSFKIVAGAVVATPCPPPTMDSGGYIWLENGRPLFTVHLECLSSVYTHDAMLSRFFRSCGSLLSSILALPFPLTTTQGGSKTKVNRVTFLDHLVEPSDVSHDTPAADRLRGSATMRQPTDASCGLHLCNAIKALLIVDQSSLVHFLPPLLNQFMEIILVSAATGHRWATMAYSECNGGAGDPLSWMCPIKPFSSHTPNEVLKTTIGTMSMLISKLNAFCPPHKTASYGSFPNPTSSKDPSTSIAAVETSKHPLLVSYAKYAFDANALRTTCASVYSSDPAIRGQRTQAMSESTLPIPLHHALVRGLILILSDLNCAEHILVHLLSNLWFPFALVINSMTRYLCTSQKIKSDRSGESRFPVSFSDDLAILIKLVGARITSPHAILHIPLPGNIAPSSDTQTGSMADGASSNSLPRTYPRRQASVSFARDSTDADSDASESVMGEDKFARFRPQPEQFVVQSGRYTALINAVNGSDVMLVTARFLGHLFHLMDRGYVMKRVRDLLVLLEIGPRMSVSEIDRLNEVRFQLLGCLSQHECFVQLNLPSLYSNIGTDRFVCELRLTDRFLQEHFLVGCILSSLSCLLSGCVDTGGWAAGHTPSALHRQPLSLLRNLLAKHTLDPRYASSKPCQARIAGLYLPLVCLVLENLSVIGPPGGALKAAVLAATTRGELRDSLALDPPNSIATSDWTKFRRNTDKQPGSTSASRPRSFASDISMETLTVSANTGHSAFDSESASISNGSGDSLSHGASVSLTSHSSAPYLTSDDKVAPHILERIAGIPIRNAPRRGGGTRELRGASERSWQFPDPIVENSVVHQQERPEAASSLTSSTLTLTELGDVCGSMDNGQTGMLNGGFASNRNKHLDPDRMDGIRLADDLYDTTDQDWGNQVLSLVGVLSVAPQTRPTSVAAQWMSSNGTAAAENSTITSVTSEHAVTAQPHQHRLPTGPHPGANAGLRRLTDKLQRELFICLLHILSTVTDDHVIALYKNFTIQERVNFLLMLNYAIQHLQYRGKQCIQKYEHISRSRVAVGRPPLPIHSQLTKRSGSAAGRTAENNVSTHGTTDDLKENGASEITDYKILLEANLATESGLIVLDLLHIFSSVFRSDLQSSKPDDPMFKGILEVYIALLSHNPSDYLIRHTFAALRVFIGRFAKVLFSQSTDVLNAVCLTSLRWANESSSRALESESTPPLADESVPLNDAVAQIRADSCSFLYKLWKCSYESFGAAGFHRVHLQTIISVSKLVSEIGPGFDCSLNLLHSLVDTDMRGSYTATNSDSKFWLFGNNRQLFADEVDDLIRRIRTVLAATAEMRQHSDDHERLVDLHYFLAKSYSSNPALRRTWLEELAKLHMSTKSLAELAMTKLHIAALMVEYLRRRGNLDRDFPHSCDDFTAISSNICQEENGLRTDSALLEIPYSQDVLLTDINEAAATLEAAGLFEAIRPVYNLVLPVYEARQDYTALAQVYRHIGRAYESTGIAEASGHRLFAAYFRVTFHGSLFKTLNGKSFVYRTNACQKLNTMCSELLTRYSKKYGPDAVDLCVDYAFNQDTADQNKAYIQVTYVEPYKPTTQSTNSLSLYARHHDVRQFMFETPFILLPGLSATASLLASGPKRSEDLTLQWKRRTVVTTEASFPHLRRRLEVVDVSETDLSPIDAAIDAISCKNHELRSHVKTISNLSLTASSNTGDSSDCSSERVTVTSIGIRSPVNCAAANWSGGGRANSDSRDVHCIPLIMDMQLQGALLPTVNAGPMAYAEAFLKAEHQSLYPADKVAHLRDLFFEFLTLCLVLLTHYHRLMSSAHEAKYHAMRQALDRYRVDLSNLLKVEITVDEKRLVIGPRSTSVSDLTASIISAASEC